MGDVRDIMNVIQKASFKGNCIWENEKGFIMFYEGVSKEDGKHRIMVAESEDGQVWKKSTVALHPGADGDWDSGGVSLVRRRNYLPFECNTTFQFLCFCIVHCLPIYLYRYLLVY